MWRFGKVDNGSVGLLIVVLVGWLGEGEHVFEDGRGEREDELVNAEVVGWTGPMVCA